MSTLEIVCIIVATAALFGWISTRVFRLPITIGTMMLTVGASLILLDIGRFVPALHAWVVRLAQQIDFQSLVLNGMLPLLLFAGAFLLDLDQLAREKLPVAVLSILGTVLSFFAVAALMQLLSFGHAAWTECLLFGALISPTDPVAVLEMLRRVGISKSIEAQLAGESLFNDGIGAVLFLTMIQIARGHAPTVGHVAGLLLLQAGGAIALGIAAAWLASRLMCLVNSYQVDILLTLSLAFGGYLLAALGHLSGPLEAVVAGIALRLFNRRKAAGRIADDRVDQFWTLIDEVQNSLLFVLLGLEVLVVALNPVTLRAGAAAILSVNAVRFAVVALCLLIVRVSRKSLLSTRGPHQADSPSRGGTSILTLTWGGLRGGLSIALALSIPATLGGNWIFGATYLVVVFSILVQGGSLHLVMSRRNRTRNSTHAAA